MSMGMNLTRRDALFLGSRLAGLYLIHDDEERALRVLEGPFDVPLLIQEPDTWRVE